MVTFETEAEARRFVRAAQLEAGAITVATALADWQADMVRRGLRPKSVKQESERVRVLLPDGGKLVTEIGTAALATAYRRRAEVTSACTHQIELAAVRRFFRFLVQENRVRRNPTEGIKPIGRRKRGKVQLTLQEAQAFASTALERAQAGDERATFVLGLLYLGCRPSELHQRVVRDLDCTADGTVLVISSGKTVNAARRLEVPEPVASLLRRQTEGKLPLAPLFAAPGGQAYRPDTEMPSRFVRELCRAAGVQQVCAYSLRGLHATLAEEAGATSHYVARALGHSSHAITEAHYLRPGTTARVRARKVANLVPLSSDRGTRPEKESYSRGS